MTTILTYARRHGPVVSALLAVALLAAGGGFAFASSATASRHQGHEVRLLSPRRARGQLGAARLIAQARARMRTADARASADLDAGMHWVASWGASPQPPYTPGRSPSGFDDVTLRSIVYTSAGGAMVRMRLTNAYGRTPLRIAAAAIGVEEHDAEIAPGTNEPLWFGGSRSVVIPAGADALSDPVSLAVKPLQKLAVSLFLPVATGPATRHSDAQQVAWEASGNSTDDSAATPFTTRIRSWYFLDSVDVMAQSRVTGAVVALGDSITDGFHSGMGANARWPNDLARRLDALSGPTLSVVDEGISGNRLLNNSPCCGADAVARFSDDVLDRAGVRDVILLEGLNDIGFSRTTGSATAPHTHVTAQEIIAGDEQLIAEAHRAGLRIYGGTLTPFEGAAYWSPAGEAERDAINRWILTSGAFDGVIDFAAAVAQPGHPDHLAPEYNSGDHLHPNAAGYQAMADAINLGMLLRG
jgi:lysophospholipase L1-like esterase